MTDLKDQDPFPIALEAYQQGDWVKAERLCHGILSKAPDFADALAVLGYITAQTNREADAELFFARALAARPDWAEPAFNRGLMLSKLNRHEEALRSFERAIELKPDYPQALCSRGVLLASAGKIDEALRSYDAAIATNREYVEAINNRAALLKEIGRLNDALAGYERALELRPDIPELHYNRGTVLFDLRRLEDAVVAHQNAIELRPEYTDAYYNLGAALAELERFDDARSAYENALTLRPFDANILNNLGATLHSMQRHDEALSVIDRALVIAPSSIAALNNRASVLREFGRIEEAEVCVEQALALDPNNLESNWHRSMLFLLRGDLRRGFRLYERRWERGLDAPKKIGSHLPVWLGQLDPKGWTILVYGEQGLGDQIQFVRYASLLADRGAEVHLQVDKPLVHLLRSVRGVKSVSAIGDPTPRADFQCPMMSLPLAFGTTLDTTPNQTPYLAPSAGRVAYWADKLGPQTKPRIGVMWSGGTRAKLRNRSIPLAEFSKLFNDDFEWISLQKEVREIDRAAIAERPTLRHFGSEQDDFMDAAALCQLVDLVITVDTSTAHLAGALAKPTWALLPFSADWRWMLERKDSPWYPTLRLYRNSANADWSALFEQVIHDLNNLRPR